MGRISLPAISKFEEVLEVLLDPQKYLQYMIEFKEAHTKAQEALGNLQAKDAADAYLAQANDKLVEADKIFIAAKIKADALVTKATNEAQSITVGAHQSIHEANLAVSEAKQELHKLDLEKESFVNFVTQANSELKVAQDKLVVDQTAVARQQEKVTSLQTKLEQAQATLRSL